MAKTTKTSKTARKPVAPVATNGSRSDLRNRCWQLMIANPSITNKELAEKVREPIGSQHLPIKYARQFREVLRAMPANARKAWLA